MIKFDQLLKESNVHVQDPGMLATYDLILATLLRYFSTCTASIGAKCTHAQHNICNTCKYVGKFAQLALDL